MAGVRNPDTLDLITFDEAKDAVRLIMVEDRKWDSEDLMYHQLQRKVDCYLQFIESGQFESQFPEYKNKDIVIQLDMAFEPSGRIVDILPRLRDLLVDKGLGFATNRIQS